MGALENERKIKVIYDPWTVNKYNSLPESVKQELTDLGEPFGYSGMNVFFFAMLQLLYIRFYNFNQEELVYKTN